MPGALLPDVELPLGLVPLVELVPLDEPLAELEALPLPELGVETLVTSAASFTKDLCRLKPKLATATVPIRLIRAKSKAYSDKPWPSVLRHKFFQNRFIFTSHFSLELANVRSA